eukprot:3941779-Rhodomonas_salina.1
MSEVLSERWRTLQQILLFRRRAGHAGPVLALKILFCDVCVGPGRSTLSTLSTLSSHRNAHCDCRWCYPVLPRPRPWLPLLPESLAVCVLTSHRDRVRNKQFVHSGCPGRCDRAGCLLCKLINIRFFVYPGTLTGLCHIRIAAKSREKELRCSNRVCYAQTENDARKSTPTALRTVTSIPHVVPRCLPVNRHRDWRLCLRQATLMLSMLLGDGGGGEWRVDDDVEVVAENLKQLIAM